MQMICHLKSFIIKISWMSVGVTLLSGQISFSAAHQGPSPYSAQRYRKFSVQGPNFHSLVSV